VTAPLAQVLLVEDDAGDELIAREAFESDPMPIELHVVRDGVEALDFLFARGAYEHRGTAQPTLVILDLKLPKLDGLGVLRTMRAHPRTALLPTVILTSSKEEQDVVAGYSLGANSYVRKPVDFAEFAEAVKVLGIYWLALNQMPPPQSAS
jgi:two-component system response regulator